MWCIPFLPVGPHSVFLLPQNFCVNTTLHCKLTTLPRLGAAFLRTFCRVRVWVEVDKRGTCIRFGRMKWRRLHCSWGLITARCHVEVPRGIQHILALLCNTAVPESPPARNSSEDTRLPQSGLSMDLSTSFPCIAYSTARGPYSLWFLWKSCLPSQWSGDYLVTVFPLLTSPSQFLPHLCEIQFLW